MLIAAYSNGIFPMADGQGGEIGWYKPDPRAIIPLNRFVVSRSLAQTVSRQVFEITVDSKFGDVIRLCADRPETWISDEIIGTYEQLAEMGIAHSVECRIENQLVGGLYGVSIGGAFFGESMFQTVTDASKVALVALVGRLRERGFLLLDAQYSTPHLEQFGVVEVPAREYDTLLKHAVRQDIDW